ncbi:unnamed protein product [Ilex paraguariensis]|uniref:Uncharacterized protein n=1 Tax=Ilex paraguariensis TaxID=185542 RepID=A0ABC8T5B7_9AQUA
MVSFIWCRCVQNQRKKGGPGSEELPLTQLETLHFGIFNLIFDKPQIQQLHKLQKNQLNEVNMQQNFQKVNRGRATPARYHHSISLLVLHSCLFCIHYATMF